MLRTVRGMKAEVENQSPDVLGVEEVRAKTHCAVLQVPDVYLFPSDKTEGIVPFMAGQQLQFTVSIQPYDRSKFAMYELL